MKKSISLYIHMPWCEKKCPYCDFNSHPLKGAIPEEPYLKKLILECNDYLDAIQDRPVQSIFIGGGTPSLISAEGYAWLMKELNARLNFLSNVEITLEANPGSTEQQRLAGYVESGINRLSLGVQSFSELQLKRIGRIHTALEGNQALEAAIAAGFKQINVDLMYGLPEQTPEESRKDLLTALSYPITHLSWYQLTLEPNTLFYAKPPSLPDEDTLLEIEEFGRMLLENQGFPPYEVSAYAPQENQCLHNLNYWRFGDYLGLGAGAHSKLTDPKTGIVKRHWNLKHPSTYLKSDRVLSQEKNLSPEDLILEFMLNNLRLLEAIPLARFQESTGLPLSALESPLKKALSSGFIEREQEVLKTTPRGRQFLNDCLSLFM